MELIFFKSDTTTPVRVRTTPDGKIDFRVLGRSMGLEPGSITLCGEWFTEIDLRSDATWTQIKNVLRVAGSSEDPVVVSGRPIPEVPTAAQQDPFRRLLTEASMDPRIPEVSELKGYLLQPPRMAFPVSQRRYLQLMN